jgi:hypothetical protein
MTDRDLVRHIERLPGGRAGYKQLVRELGANFASSWGGSLVRGS